ncbi:MAG: PQQ-dependent sugar dehydrogenase [Chloroflexi bacterium]|nr:PQQ-dependent sugar dehydrogenase [Chloroflexota bacterium]
MGCISLVPTGRTPIAKPEAVSTDEIEQPDPSPDDRLRHPPGGLPRTALTPAAARTAPATPWRVEPVVDNVSFPIGLSWLPDGRMLFSEVFKGQVRILERGRLQDRPFAQVQVAKGAETGALGIAVDPDFTSNHYVYLYYSDEASGRNQVVRFTEQNGVGTDMNVILVANQYSKAGVHNAGRLVFAPDKTLFVSVGNGQNSKIGQDPCKLGGKILHVNRDGTPAAGNPSACAPVYAWGFRNPMGLAYDAKMNVLLATENGGEGHDELDLVRVGANYGHPIVEGTVNDPRFVDPVWESEQVSIGPSGLTVYRGDMLPEFDGDVFFCGVHTGQLSRARLRAPSYDQVESVQVDILKPPERALETQPYECRLDVATGPDGALYFSHMTSIWKVVR